MLVHPVCPPARTRPAPPTLATTQRLTSAGRAWLSSYYLVFLACFLDLAESSKKAHGTEGTPQLRSCQKEGSHQKQSDLQGNQGRHEPARMCSFARLACCRRRRASYRPLRTLGFLSLSLSVFGVSVLTLVLPAAARAETRDATGARGHAAAVAALPLSPRRPPRMQLDISSHAFTFYFSLLYQSIGRESSRCLNSSVLVARSPHGFL